MAPHDNLAMGDVMNDPGAVRLRQTKHMPPNTGRPGKSEASAARSPARFAG